VQFSFKCSINRLPKLYKTAEDCALFKAQSHITVSILVLWQNTTLEAFIVISFTFSVHSHGHSQGHLWEHRMNV